MPNISRRQRRVEDEDDSEPATQARRTQWRREASEEIDDEHMDVDGEEDAGQTSHQHLVKNLVRLALASEYSRIPLRRSDINQKALNGASRKFKAVFDDAQFALTKTFGMELRELPQREKITLQQKRTAAQKGNTQSQGGAATANKTWILCSALPEAYLIPDIVTPSKIPTAELEGAYTGLYTFIISVIMLAGGELPEAKLERCLKRANADQSTPVERTDKLLARMVKDGYIQRVRDNSSGDEIVTYSVGPRGKVEVGEPGVSGLARAVYGDSEREELDKKLERILALSRTVQPAAEQATAGDHGAARKRGRPRRGQADLNGLEDDDDGEEG